MKRLIFSVISLATALSFSACDPKVKVRRDKPVPVPKDIDDPRSVTKQNRDPDDLPPPDKKRHIEDPDPVPPVKRIENIPPPPKNNPEYAIKADGKPGYVQSPYDGQHRLIDVRGLPPGTEAECPYTRRTFLVPP